MAIRIKGTDVLTDSRSIVNLIDPLSVSLGGTGASTASEARTNLGLGSISTQNFNSVNITGGSITGITDLAIADGGTGANTAAGAASNLAAAFGNLLYPVGSIYINATNSTNPATLLGFGTWVAFGAGRVPVGFDSGDTNFNAAEKTGGSKDAIVVSHTHSLSSTTSSAGSHLHSIYGSTSYNELKGVRGTNAAVFAAGAFGINNPGYYQTFTTGNNAISTEGAHTHSLSGDTNTTGSSGANANLQPYITVYMWKRTA